MNSAAYEYFELGKKKYYRYDRRGAAEEFREALLSEPGDPTIFGWLALTLCQLSEFDEAIEIINQEKERETAEVYIAKGIISDKRDANIQLANEHYSKAIFIDPGNEMGYVMRGFLNLDLNKYTNAESDLNKAVKTNPNTYVYTIYGQVKRKKGDNQGAVADFTKAIDLDPNNHIAWQMRGNLRRDFGDKENAFTDLNKAVEINPEYTMNYFYRGFLRKEMGDFEGAMADYNKAIELDPGNVEAWANRASLRKKMKDYNGALYDYSKAIKLDPIDTRALERRGSLKYVFLNDYNGALIDYDKAIELDPENNLAWANRASLREEMKDYNGALYDFSKAIELDPNDTRVLERRGRLKHAILKDNDGALADYDKAIELDPGYRLAWANRGSLLKDLGDTRKALTSFNRAIEIEKNDSWSMDHRADLLKSLGQYELSLADRSRYYELEGIPMLRFDDAKRQEAFDSIHNHLLKTVKSELEAKGERFLEYWEGILYWGADQSHSLNQGKQTYIHYGKYGMGYLCLSNKNLRIISIGDLSKKFVKGYGLGKKFLFALLSNLDLRTTEENDKLWVVPYKDIQGISKENEMLHLVTTSETWEIFSLWSDDEYLRQALELARTGKLMKLIDIEKLRMKPKLSSSEEEIFEKIERLAYLREKGIITPEEFDQKKKELLARI